MATPPSERWSSESLRNYDSLDSSAAPKKPLPTPSASSPAPPLSSSPFQQEPTLMYRIPATPAFPFTPSLMNIPGSPVGSSCFSSSSLPGQGHSRSLDEVIAEMCDLEIEKSRFEVEVQLLEKQISVMECQSSAQFQVCCSSKQTFTSLRATMQRWWKTC